MSSSYLLDPLILTVLAERGDPIWIWDAEKANGYLIKTSYKYPSYIAGGGIDPYNVCYCKNHDVYDDVVLFDGRHLLFRMIASISCWLSRL